MKHIALIALGALAATPALADKTHSDATQMAAAPSTQDEAPAASAPERKTCRHFANSANRVSAIKLCLTKEGWRKFDEQQEQQ